MLKRIYGIQKALNTWFSEQNCSMASTGSQAQLTLSPFRSDDHRNRSRFSVCSLFSLRFWFYIFSIKCMASHFFLNIILLVLCQHFLLRFQLSSTSQEQPQLDSSNTAYRFNNQELSDSFISISIKLEKVTLLTLEKFRSKSQCK